METRTDAYFTIMRLGAMGLQRAMSTGVVDLTSDGMLAAACNLGLVQRLPGMLAYTYAPHAEAAVSNLTHAETSATPITVETMRTLLRSGALTDWSVGRETMDSIGETFTLSLGNDVIYVDAFEDHGRVSHGFSGRRTLTIVKRAGIQTIEKLVGYLDTLVAADKATRS
jgi:hypothetical protein